MELSKRGVVRSLRPSWQSFTDLAVGPILQMVEGYIGGS
jgi:hypothetical protein